MASAQDIFEDEGEALIESSFRRLLTAVEAERSRIRSTWQEVTAEKDQVREEVNALKQQTEDQWNREKSKIDNKYKELDGMRERMTLMNEDSDVQLKINCSGHHMQVPVALLVGPESGLLANMFSDAFCNYIPRDAQGYYFLDFNPTCFKIILKYVAECKKRAGPGLPDFPRIPPEEQMNFDFLVEALKIKILLRPNIVKAYEKLSLRITSFQDLPGRSRIETTTDGYQVIPAAYPVPLTGQTYFEVKVISNPSAKRKQKGGLAIGVCGHQPTGEECYSIASLKGAILYSSGNGLVGKECIGTSNVQQGVFIGEDSSFGVKFDPTARTLTWYVNFLSIGSCRIALGELDRFAVVYPIFALYDKNQVIEVDFSLTGPHDKSRRDIAPIQDGAQQMALGDA
jgi:hypothetical protein